MSGPRKRGNVFPKACTRCGELKGQDDFPRTGKLADGSPQYGAACRICTNRATREWKAKNAEKLREYEKQPNRVEYQRQRKQTPEVKARAHELWLEKWKARTDHEAKRKGYRKLQDATAENASNHRKEWTGPELEIIMRPGITAHEAARLLGRTLSAVMHMRKACRNDPRKIELAGIRSNDEK